jgi:hypothetical protein
MEDTGNLAGILCGASVREGVAMVVIGSKAENQT